MLEQARARYSLIESSIRRAEKDVSNFTVNNEERLRSLRERGFLVAMNHTTKQMVQVPGGKIRETYNLLGQFDLTLRKYLSENQNIHWAVADEPISTGGPVNTLTTKTGVGNMVFHGLRRAIISADPNIVTVKHDISGIRKLLATTGQIINENGCLVIFPEGQIHTELQPAQQGIGLLARKLEVPILPVGVQLLEGHTNFWIGDIIEPYEIKDMKSQQIADKTMHAIASMLPEEMRGYYSSLNGSTLG